MAGFRDFYGRAKAHYGARATNEFTTGVDDVRHKLIEEGWFGRQTTGDIAKDEVPEIAPAKEEPPPAAKDPTVMQDTSFSYAAWYRRQNPSGQPVSAEPALGEATAADIYGTSTPGVEATTGGMAQHRNVYGLTTPTAEPTQSSPAHNAPDHEPGL